MFKKQITVEKKMKNVFQCADIQQLSESARKATSARQTAAPVLKIELPPLSSVVDKHTLLDSPESIEHTSLELKPIKSNWAIRCEREFTNKTEKLLRTHYVRQHASVFDRDDLTFMPNWALIAALPYSEPDPLLNGWTRTTARSGVVIQPGLYPDQESGKLASYGYPFGIYPRLFLLWLTTHVQRTKELVHIDPYFVSFGSPEIGLALQSFLFPNPRKQLSFGKAGTFYAFKSQLIRLLAANMAITTDPSKKEWQLDKLNIVDGANLKNLNEATGVDLWQMGLQLNKQFYERILESVVPLDLAIVKTFGKSAQCIDIYAWLSHQAYMINNHIKRDRLYDWKLLESFFGGEAKYYTFRATFKRNFKVVALAWPGLGQFCELSDGDGLTMKPGIPLTVQQSLPTRNR